ANLATRVRGSDLEEKEFALPSEIPCGGYDRGSNRRGCSVGNIDADTNRQLAVPKRRVKKASTGYLHDCHHARSGEHGRKSVFRIERQSTGEIGRANHQFG